MSNQNHCCSEQHRPRQTAKTNPGNICEKNMYTQRCPLRQKLPDKMSNQNHCCSEQHRQRQTVSQVSHIHADVALRRRHDAWSSYDDMCTVTLVTPTPSVSRPRRRRPPTSSRRSGGAHDSQAIRAAPPGTPDFAPRRSPDQDDTWHTGPDPWIPAYNASRGPRNSMKNFAQTHENMIALETVSP